MTQEHGHEKQKIQKKDNVALKIMSWSWRVEKFES